MRRVIAPTLRYSQYLYEEALSAEVRSGVTWLDLGCGHQILPEWREVQERDLVAQCKTVVGVDYDLLSLRNHRTIARRVRGSISRLPFQDSAFDLATANMVVEHLDDPPAAFREIARVLKPGGVFICHTPNALGYGALLARVIPQRLKILLARLLEGRCDTDVFPAYYRANTRGVIARVAADAGLYVTKARMAVSDAGLVMIPPLGLLELLWIRALMLPPLKPLRTHILAVLTKRQT